MKRTIVTTVALSLALLIPSVTHGSAAKKRKRQEAIARETQQARKTVNKLITRELKKMKASDSIENLNKNYDAAAKKIENRLKKGFSYRGKRMKLVDKNLLEKRIYANLGNEYVQKAVTVATNLDYDTVKKAKDLEHITLKTEEVLEKIPAITLKKADEEKEALLKKEIESLQQEEIEPETKKSEYKETPEVKEEVEEIIEGMEEVSKMTEEKISKEKKEWENFKTYLLTIAQDPSQFRLYEWYTQMNWLKTDKSKEFINTEAKDETIKVPEPFETISLKELKPIAYGDTLHKKLTEYLRSLNPIEDEKTVDQFIRLINRANEYPDQVSLESLQKMKSWFESLPKGLRETAESENVSLFDISKRFFANRKIFIKEKDYQLDNVANMKKVIPQLDSLIESKKGS